MKGGFYIQNFISPDLADGFAKEFFISFIIVNQNFGIVVRFRTYNREGNFFFEEFAGNAFVKIVNLFFFVLADNLFDHRRFEGGEFAHDAFVHHRVEFDAEKFPRLFHCQIIGFQPTIDNLDFRTKIFIVDFGKTRHFIALLATETGVSFGHSVGAGESQPELFVILLLRTMPKQRAETEEKTDRDNRSFAPVPAVLQLQFGVFFAIMKINAFLKGNQQIQAGQLDGGKGKPYGIKIR